MSAPLAIIIPTLNAAGDLPETAEALLPGVVAGLVRELVVSDGGSADDTLLIARELGALIVEGPPGRGGQIGRGVSAATAPWLLVLHADSIPVPGWAAAVGHHMEHHPDKAGWFDLAFRAKGVAPSLVAAGANLRSRWFGMPYGDQGLLISRDLLAGAGGVPDLPLMEDVMLARALRGRLRPLGLPVRTSAARYERDGWARRVIRNLGTLARFLLGVPPERLVHRYERRQEGQGRDHSSAN